MSVFLQRLGILSSGVVIEGTPVLCPTGSYDFSFIERFSDISAWQGAAFDGEFFYTTAYKRSDSEQFWITKLDRDLNVVLRRNLGMEGGAAHTQVNGIHYSSTDSRLYVCANNYSTSPHRGWVFEVDLDDLSVTAFTELTGAKWSEAVFPWSGSWWEVNASGHEIRQFNSSFTLTGTHALPDTTPGGLFWQAVFVYDDIFYVNLHAGASGDRLRAYTWNGSGFDVSATSLTPPSVNATQCVFSDGCKFLYWAERDSGAGEGHIAKTSIVDGLLLDGHPYLEARNGEAYAGFTVVARNGTGPYVYSVESGSLPTGVTINSSSGVVSGTPTVDGTFADIILKVVDATGTARLLAAFTLEVYPVYLLDFAVTVAAADIGAKLYGFPLAIDLSNMPATFWANVASDGGDIRAYGGHGATELPLDMVVINTGAETGFIVVKTDLSDVNSTIINIALDGTGGLRAASHIYGRYNVWPSYRYEGVYAFINDLTDRTENANHLTVRTGSVTYGTGTFGIGGGLDTNGADLQVANSALAGAAYTVFPATLMVTANRRTETASNQIIASLGTGISSATRKLCLGEQNSTSKFSYFTDSGGFDDSAISSTLGVDVVMHGTNQVGVEKFYVNGVLEISPAAIDAVTTSDDTLVVGNAMSASYWRGDIGMVYLAKEEHSVHWCLAEFKMLTLNSTFAPISVFIPQPAFSNVTYLADHEGAADESTSLGDLATGGVDNPHSFTYSGNAKNDTGDSKFGSGSSIQQSTGSIWSGYSADWRPHTAETEDTDEFCFEFHVKLVSIASTQYFYNRYVTAGDQRIFFTGFDQPGGVFRFAGWNTGTSNLFVIDGTTIVATGVWYHFAVTRENDFTGTPGSEDIIRLFVDGVQEGSFALGSTDGLFGGTSNGPNIGDLGGGGGQMNGRIDNMRVVIGEPVYITDFTGLIARHPTS